jgi:hypothetical protein
MNTPAVAQNLASRGRGEDKMLVHMTPSEVEGLQALAMSKGGSLTINPETGLPEAGFLSDTFKALAPTIIGAGLTYFTGMPAWAAGLTVGGVEGARTGDLGRGLMAGLGAYGGANLVGGLSGFGAAQAGQTSAAQTGQALSGGVDTTALSKLGGGMTSNVAGAGTAGGPGLMGGSITGSASAPGTTGSYFSSNYGPATNAVQPVPVEAIKPATFTDVPVTDYSFSAGTPDYKVFTDAGTQGLETTIPRQETAAIFDQSYGVGEADKIAMAREGYAPSFRQNIDTGIARLGEKGGFSEFAKTYPGGKLGMAALIAPPAIKSLEAAGAFDQPELALQEETDYNYEGPYLPAERNVRFRGRDAILGGEGREFKFFDPVNPVPNVRTASDGGLMSAKMAQGGRYLDGPGDGVSDSIPATVDGEQPVLLSEGEYIIPAEVVSAVGNGSSDAGAEKFTKLVDTIMAKTRRVTKGKPNGADKLLKGLVPQTA